MLELKEVPLAMLDMVDGVGAKDESPMPAASVLSPPAAAIICGLSGLVEALAKLPFLECCMP